MKHLISIVLLYFAAISVARADECASWTHRAYPVTLEACSYDDGGSGYYRITNNGSQDADVCWDVVSSDGGHDEGCNSHLAAGDSTRGSCFQCGANNEGVQHILLTKYEVISTDGDSSSSGDQQESDDEDSGDEGSDVMNSVGT